MKRPRKIKTLSTSENDPSCHFKPQGFFADTLYKVENVTNPLPPTTALPLQYICVMDGESVWQKVFDLKSMDNTG